MLPAKYVRYHHEGQHAEKFQVTYISVMNECEAKDIARVCDQVFHIRLS